MWIFKLTWLFSYYIPSSYLKHDVRQNGKVYRIHDAQLSIPVSDTDIKLKDITTEIILYMRFHSIHLLEDLKQYYPGWFNTNYKIVIRFYDEDDDDLKRIKFLRICVNTEKYYISDANMLDQVDLPFGEILFEP